MYTIQLPAYYQHRTSLISKFISDVLSLNLISFNAKTSRVLTKLQRIFPRPFGPSRIEMKIPGIFSVMAQNTIQLFQLSFSGRTRLERGTLNLRALE